MSAPAPPPPQLHPEFDDPKADLTLISSNGSTSFNVRRYQLQAASSVFEDMVDTLDGGPLKKRPRDERITMNLAEESLELEMFLRFVVRDVMRPKSLELRDATSLLRLGDKYAAPFVTESAVRFLDPYLDEEAAYIFGAAVVYHHPKVARSALSRFGKVSTKTVVNLPSHPTNPHSNPFGVTRGGAILRGGRGGGESLASFLRHQPAQPPCSECGRVDASNEELRLSPPRHLISSIPVEFVEKFPLALLLRLFKMQEEVSFANGTWKALALTLTDL